MVAIAGWSGAPAAGKALEFIGTKAASDMWLAKSMALVNEPFVVRLYPDY